MSVSFGILGTYPPTQCGLASFSNSLLEALRSDHDEVGIVAVVDTLSPAPHPDVTHQWVRHSPTGVATAVAGLDSYDIAVIQHEYGIYPGSDGIEAPSRWPGPSRCRSSRCCTRCSPPAARLLQRFILEELALHSAAVVTMTHTAKHRLIEHYTVDPAKIHVIPHGAVDNRPPATLPHQGGAADAVHRSTPPVILTWGLLGEGKGIEWAIEAMALLQDLHPRPEYHVVGQTHPRVLERLGERYRDGLIELAADRGVSDSVAFDARYQSKAELNALVQAADVILLPYDSLEQVTSGVLIEAVTGGKPVVSTGFPHARELLAGGAGLLVERQDPAGIAAALRRVFTEPGLAASMAAEASRIAPDLLWPAVADGYAALAAQAIAPASILESA